MPLIQQSAYIPRPVFKNRHLHTIYPSLFRKVRGVEFTRERIATPDDDFLDLDWFRQGSDKLVLTIHGLEGSSRSHYISGMIKAFQRRGWDGVALNFRGCSGEPNRLLRSYHSGATEDLETLVRHVLQKYSYRQIALVGFSLGGNLVLKYLGEQGAALPQEIFGAAAVSTPCDLASSARQLSEKYNVLYLKNFLRCFRKKIRAKMQRMPDKINDQNFHEITSLEAFDDRYTAPIHGFANAEDYWARCSSKQFLADIQVPTLLLNARDDPFLSELSYPVEEAASHKYLFLEMPDFGGHLGFIARNPAGEYWHETRICSFLLSAEAQIDAST
ncbi:MAG: alpha/beta fold hydrolase [bacterium]|nr:alpha/beta fold hydrolase [bacterium]